MKRIKGGYDPRHRTSRLEECERRTLLAADVELVATASLSGHVYRDENLNGIRDRDGIWEPGLAAVTITLTGVDDLQRNIERTTLTSHDGEYRFTELPPGVYTLTANQSASTVDGLEHPGTINGVQQGIATPPDSISQIQLRAGQAGTGYDFGELWECAIFGEVFHDTDDDGLFENDIDEVLSNVTVTLSGTDYAGNLLSRSTSSNSGDFEFRLLPPGAYEVILSSPPGYRHGRIVSNDQSAELVDGGLLLRLNRFLPASVKFAELSTAILSGYVFQDLDIDGTKDSNEPGIPGVTVTLTGLEGTDGLTRAAVSSADGGYVFDHLVPGKYSLVETQPFPLYSSREATGNVNGELRGLPGFNRIDEIILNAGEIAVDFSFGEVLPVSISGFVYHDANDNGRRDSGEGRIYDSAFEPISIELSGITDTGETVKTTAVVDRSPNSEGRYEFTGLRPGKYTVLQRTQPGGLLDGLDSGGTVGGIARGYALNDIIAEILLVQGEDSIDNNFGELRPASLSGIVYLDDENDGIWTPDEPRLSRFEIRLDGETLSGQPVHRSMLTDVSGGYSFADLRPGRYALTKVQRPGFLDGRESIGPTNQALGGVLVAPDTIGDIHLGGGSVGLQYNFGQLLHSTLAGSVFVDADDDGVRDAGELGIPNVELRLAGKNDLGQDIERITRTSRTGEYLFSSLRPGTYVIAEVQPGQFLDGRDSTDLAGAAVGGDIISGMVVVSGTQSLANNFGELRLGEPFAGPTLTAPRAFQNPVLPTDVDDDLTTVPLDVLIVINALNAANSPELPAVRGSEEYIDVNGDSLLTALDALLIINWLNDLADAGSQALPAQSLTADEAFALAVDQALRQIGSEDDDIVTLALRGKLPR